MGYASMPEYGDVTTSAQDAYALSALPHTPDYWTRAIRTKTAQSITLDTPMKTGRVLDFAAGETRMVTATKITSTTGTIADIEVML